MRKKGGRGRLGIRYKVREMKNGAQGEEEKDKFRNKKKNKKKIKIKPNF